MDYLLVPLRFPWAPLCTLLNILLNFLTKFPSSLITKILDCFLFVTFCSVFALWLTNLWSSRFEFIKLMLPYASISSSLRMRSYSFSGLHHSFRSSVSSVFFPWLNGMSWSLSCLVPISKWPIVSLHNCIPYFGVKVFHNYWKLLQTLLLVILLPPRYLLNHH